MSVTILVKHLIITGTHGAHLPTATPKEFIIDIEIVVDDIGDAVASDDIAYVFDYRVAVAIARRVIEGEPLHLIETLASRIAEKILEQPHVQKLNLALKKREVHDTYDSGIIIERSQI